MNSHGKTLAAKLALGFGFVICMEASSAEGRIEARLRLPDSPDPAHPARVILELKNVGDEPASFMKWDTPFVEAGGRLPRPVFNVEDEGGQPIRYLGTYVNFAGMTANSFIELAPLVSVTKEVDLSGEYEFGQGGTFHVRFTLNMTHRPDPDITPELELQRFHGGTSQVYVESNGVDIRVPGSVRAPRPQKDMSAT